jgi:dCMP deaminase
MPRKGGDLSRKSTNSKPYEDRFFRLAEDLSRDATCPRKHVGCIIVNKQDIVIVGGHNGAPEGMPTCLDEGCLMEGGHCIRSVHAEIRAIAFAAQYGMRLHGCVAYTTLLPCLQCLQALLESGISAIHYDEVYDREEKKHVFQLAQLGNIQLIERIRS